ncbi:Speckle-type POZ, partial [Cichlidogyrus casuarinus]
IDVKPGQPTSTTSSLTGVKTYSARNSVSPEKEIDKPNQSDQKETVQEELYNTEPTVRATSTVSSSQVPKVLKEFKAHKAVLAARSPVFAAMFEHRMEEAREGRVEINDLKPDCMADVLQYIYTGRCSNLDQLAPELLAASDKYQMDQLKIMCEHRLVQGLCVENACDTLVLSDRHNALQLKVHALDYIMLHAEEICETEGFDELSRLQPHLLNECFRALAVQHLPLRYSTRKRRRPTP